MTTKPENPDAFPCTEYHPAYEFPNFRPGMTLRDWFAGQALAGSLANPNIDRSYKADAESAYASADAMLAARREED